MLDAPVSGGSQAAVSATLSIMVGGDKSAFDRCHPLLSALGKTITYMGPSGAGQLTKLCNQICVVVNQLGAAEAVLMAERSGVDVSRMRDALMGGFGASRMFEVQVPKMAARDFRGAIESRLHDKDLRLVLEVAKELGITLPTAALAASILDKLQQEGGGRLDSAAIYSVLEQGFTP
jgi:3-hydroxyisobutyrate dehydrogenase-like beta-hydroxyacid dehydrogenase